MKRTIILLMSALILLLCCGCGTQTAFSGTETAVPASVTEPVTEPAPVVTLPVTESVTEAVAESAVETVPTETEPVTEPTEPQPVELTFSYPEGIELQAITSEEGITLRCDDNNRFITKSYGIQFLPTVAAVMKGRLFDYTVTFNCINGEIEQIEVLGANRNPITGPDGDPMEPIKGNSVPGQYMLTGKGYYYLRIFGITDEGKEFQLLLVAGTF